MNSTELMQEMATVRPDVYGELIKTAEEVKESPYAEDIQADLDRLMKVAMGQMGDFAVGVGAQIAQGIAFQLAGDMFDSLRRGITKSRNYKNMLSANPDLKNGGPKVRQAFDVLHQFNPEFSSNPTVAGSYVRNQSNLDGGQYGDLQMLGGLVSSHKSMADSRKLPVHQIARWDNNPSKHESPLDINYKTQQLKKLEQDIKNQGELHPQQIKKIMGEVEQLGKRNNPELFQAGIDKAVAEAKILGMKSGPKWMGMEREKLRGESSPRMRGLKELELGQRTDPTLHQNKVEKSRMDVDQDYQAELRLNPQRMNPLQELQAENLRKTMPSDTESNLNRQINELALQLEKAKVQSPANKAAPYFGKGSPEEKYIPGRRK